MAPRRRKCSCCFSCKCSEGAAGKEEEIFSFGARERSRVLGTFLCIPAEGMRPGWATAAAALASTPVNGDVDLLLSVETSRRGTDLLALLWAMPPAARMFVVGCWRFIFRLVCNLLSCITAFFVSVPGGFSFSSYADVQIYR